MNPLALPSWLVECTLQGSLAIVVVWLAAPLVRRLLGAQAAYVLWAVVLLRLLVPWLPPSPFHWGAPKVSPVVAVVTVETEAKEEAAAEVFVEPDSKIAAAPKTATPSPPVSAPVAVLPGAPWPWAFLIWIAGTLVILTLAVVRNIRAGCLAQRSRDVSSDAQLREALRPLSHDNLRIRETGELRSPALMGLWRPTILLPLDWRERFSREQLGYVLAHEMGHCRRVDLWWRWAFLFAKAIHWFNPLVWLAERAARTDQEMACDEWVLARRGGREVQDYGETLLVLSQRLETRGVGWFVAAEMAETRQGLRRRIRQLTHIRSRGWGALCGALGLSGFLIVLTGPAQSEDAAASASPLPVQAEPTSVSEAPAQDTKIELGCKLMEVPNALVPEFQKKLEEHAEGSGAGLTGLYSEQAYQDLLRSLSQTKGLDLLSAPSITTKSGLHSTVTFMHDALYPTDYGVSLNGKVERRADGSDSASGHVTLECDPKLRRDGSIELVLRPMVKEFIGLTNFGGSRAAKSSLDQDAVFDTYQPSSDEQNLALPIFDKRETVTSIVLRPGQTAILAGIPAKGGNLSNGYRPDSPDKPESGKKLFFLVTAFPPKEETVVSLGLPGNQQSAPSPVPGREIRKATLPLDPARPVQVEIESKLCLLSGNAKNSSPTLGVYGEERLKKLWEDLASHKDASWISLPKVTTKSDRKAIIHIVREFRYPTAYERNRDGPSELSPANFETKNVGITTENTPIIHSNGSVDLEVDAEIVGFKGMVNFGGSRAARRSVAGDALADMYGLKEASSGLKFEQPIFSTAKIRSKVTLRTGETLAVGKLAADIGGLDQVVGKGAVPPGKGEQTLVLFIKATALNAEGKLPEPGKPTSVGAPPPRFYGVPVPGLPGMVMSPYAPAMGDVDVGPFAPGTLVVDPYTGQKFLVPPADGSPPVEPGPDPKSPLGRARGIVIPEIEFREASLSEALDLAHRKAMEFDPNDDPARRGVNLVLKIGPEQLPAKKLTAKWTGLTLEEVLRRIAGEYGMFVQGESFAMEIVPEKSVNLVSVSYELPAAVVEDLQKAKEKGQKYWGAHGINFPPGATVFQKTPSRLVLRNTKEEQEKVMKLLTEKSNLLSGSGG